MGTATINGKLTISYPDGFHEMSQSELTAENHYGEVPKLCLSDPKRHIKISFSFKKYSALTSALADPKGTVKSMQKRVSKLLSGYNYSLKGYCEQKIGALTAYGFDYSYEAQKINMLAKSFIAKGGRTFYYIHCYYRAELEAESLPVINEILSGS